MGFFSNILGKKTSKEEQVRQAGALLREVKETSAHSAKKALQMLKKQGKTLYKAVGIGGELHREYVQLVEEVQAMETLESSPALPTVEVVPWSTWNNPKLQDLNAMARDMGSEIMYCRAAGSSSCNNAFLEVEALRFFASDPSVVMVIIQEENMLFRTSFLLEAAETLDPALEEIGQELADYARQTGRKMVNL